MKKASLGWPSSERRNEGSENKVNSLIRRAEEVAVRFLKWDAEFERAIMSGG